MKSRDGYKNKMLEHSSGVKHFAETPEQVDYVASELAETLEDPRDVSVSLSGGGLYVVYTWRIMEKLLAHGIQPKEVLANSGGCIPGLLYAKGVLNEENLAYMYGGLLEDDITLHKENAHQYVIAKLLPFTVRLGPTASDEEQKRFHELLKDQSMMLLDILKGYHVDCLFEKGAIQESSLIDILKKLDNRELSELLNKYSIYKEIFNDVKHTQGVNFSVIASVGSKKKPDEISGFKEYIKAIIGKRSVKLTGAQPVLDSIVFSTTLGGMITGKVKNRYYSFGDGFISGNNLPSKDRQILSTTNNIEKRIAIQTAGKWGAVKGSFSAFKKRLIDKTNPQLIGTPSYEDADIVISPHIADHLHFVKTDDMEELIAGANQYAE